MRLARVENYGIGGIPRSESWLGGVGGALMVGNVSSYSGNEPIGKPLVSCGMG